MAVSIYQNQTAFEIIVATANSSMSLYPMEYVGGSYYHHIPELTDVTDQNIDPLDVKYFYPETGESGTSLNGFDTATGTLPVVVSVIDTAFTVSLNPIGAANILPGEVVKSISASNGFTYFDLTDTVYFTAGAGISVEPSLSPSTLTINNTQLGLTDVYATAPLYLTLGEGNVSLEGSIAITPTDNGGAVALQAFGSTPQVQSGQAAINSLTLGSFPFGEIIPEHDRLLIGRNSSFGFGLAPITSLLLGDGAFNLIGPITPTAGLNTTKFSLYEALSLQSSDGLINQFEEDTAVKLISFSTSGTSYVEIPFHVRDLLYLTESTIYPNTDTYGRIEGLQQTDYTSPFVYLRSIDTQTVPLIRLVSGYTDGETNSNIFLDVVDGHSAKSLISLHGDGVITAKKIEADVVEATTIFADNIFGSTLHVVGPDTIYVTTAGGPRTIIADCSNGPVVIQLPNLASFDKSLTITVLKIDTTNNNLSILVGDGSTINGSNDALNIVTQYAGKTITSSGVNWYITGTVG